MKTEGIHEGNLETIMEYGNKKLEGQMEGEPPKMASRSREKCLCWMALQKGPEDLEKVAVLGRKIFFKPLALFYLLNQ